MDSSFVLGNNITRIPLFLAYSTPPQSGIKIKETKNKEAIYSRPRLIIKGKSNHSPNIPVGNKAFLCLGKVFRNIGDFE